MSGIIGSFVLLRLARQNKLSLELRHQWRKRTGWDPVNVARAKVLNRAWLLCWCACVLVFAVAYMLPETWQTIPLTLAITLFLLGIALTGFADNVPPDAKGFGKAFGHFLVWTNSSPADTAILDLPDLRKRAESVLVAPAGQILRLEEKEKETPGLFRKHEHIKSHNTYLARLEERYDVLASLGLAYGGYEHFFELAEEKLEAEKKKSATV